MRIAPLTFALAIGFAAPVFAQEEAVRPLVNADWVKANVGKENVVVLDIRDKIKDTDLGDKPYIANAVVAPYASAGWRTEVNGVPGMLPPLDQITKLIGDLGIDNDDHVVIVPWGTNSTEFGGATRVYWTFKYLGHDQVSILDGGWRQYDAAEGERVAEPVKPEPAKFEYELQENLLATTEEVEAALKSGMKLIDGRPVEQFEGKSKSPSCASKVPYLAPSTSSMATSTAPNTHSSSPPRRSRRWPKASALLKTRKTSRFATPATGHRLPGSG